VVKFKITAERVSVAATVPEYIGALMGNIASQMSLLPKLVVDDKENYIVEIVHDEDGDIAEAKNLTRAQARMNNITPARFEKLRDELREALKAIVNPPKGGDSKKPPFTEQGQPPPG